jgi:YVTN family beta-propeller protein
VAEIEEVTHDAAGRVVLVGEAINFSLDANETGGTASVDIVPVNTGIVLYDDGTHGDDTAGDGVYERTYVAQATDEVSSAQVVGHFTDHVGNVAADETAADPITINGPPPPVLLSTPSGADVTSSTVTLNWSQSAAADFNRYRVFRSQSAGVDTLDSAVGSPITNPAVTTITDTDPSLQPGQTYFYRVFVWDDLGLATGSNEVSATIDSWPSRVQTSIAVGPWPVEITRLPRQGLPDLAYVSHFNDGYLKVTAINTASNTVQTTVDVGSKTVGIAADPWDRSVLVSCFDTKSLALINPTSQNVTGTVELEGAPWGVGAMLGYDDRPYATVARDSGITVVALVDTPGVFKDFPLPTFPGAVTTSPDNFRFYVGDVAASQVYALDAEYWYIAGSVTGVTSPSNLSVYGEHLYVVDSDTDELVVFNKYSHSQIARVPVGDRPMLAVRLQVPQGSPPSPYVYVSNYDDGTVGVVDVNTWQMIDEIPVGGATIGPWGLLAMPDGEHVYVVNQGQATVSLIGY